MKLTRRTTVVAALSGLALAFASPAAFATVLDYWVQSGMYVATGYGPQHVNDTGRISQTSPLTQTLTSDGQIEDVQNGIDYGPVSAHATETATAFYGALSASGSGFASPTVGRTGTFAQAEPNAGGAPLSSYADQLLIASSTLAIGTPVTLSFTLSFAGTSSFVSEPGGTSDPADVLTRFEMYAEGPDAPQAHFDRTFDSSGAYVETSTVSVGDVINIFGFLTGHGIADSGHAFGDSSFSFEGQANEFVDVGTPGAFLVSGSGHDYSSPSSDGGGDIGVPEPSPAPLFALGLAGIGFMVIKRRADHDKRTATRERG